MPPLRTYSDEKAIYSVDMMLAYLNTHKHPMVSIPMSDFEWQLEQNVWGDWSPKDVLEHMTAKKYAENAERIRHADLSYPIIVTSKGVLVDGYHRVAKAYKEGKTTMKAYVFDGNLMKKFILDKDRNFVHVHQEMTVYQILELFYKRFCQ